MFTDSHCHLNRLDLTKYDGQLAGAIDAMKAANVTRAMAIMCDFAEYDEIDTIIKTYSDEQLNLGMSVGIHPCEDISVLQSASTERLIDTAACDHVWAVGETGLDYYWSTENAHEQRESFARHIHASQALKKPLIVHMRDAKEDTLDILKAEGAEHGIIHCFTEDWETAKRALDLGFYISFSGIVSFKSAQMIKEAAQNMPKDRILIETDSPYLAPVPKRGRPNEPAFVPYVADCLAELHGCTTKEIGTLTAKNFENLLAQYR